MQVSHTPHHLDIAFDDSNLVAHAGLALSSQLAARLEVRKLIRQRLHLGSGVPGAAHADLKAMTEAGGTWWDVAIPEVSLRPEVRAARAAYVDQLKKRT